MIDWTDEAWEQYLEWQDTDKKKLKKINSLIKDIQRNGPLQGTGKPEALKREGSYSRLIDDCDRLVYFYDETGRLCISSCKGHYDD